MGLGGLSLLVSLVMLKEQVGTNAQTFGDDVFYRIPVNFSEGITANGNLTCDDVVVSSYLCPNNWTSVADSDGYECLQLVETEAPFDTAQYFCSSMGGRLVTILSEQRQRAIENFLSSQYNVTPWIGLRKYSYYDNTYYWQAVWPNTVSYINSNDYYLRYGYCCGNECAYMMSSGLWATADCYYYAKPYLCETDATNCTDGVIGDNCDKACHCYGEPCKGGQPCEYGCEPGWTGPYCCTRTRKAEITYYCVNSPSDGRYVLIRINPFGREYKIVQLLDESGNALPWCSSADMSYDIDGVYSIKIRVTAENETDISCGGNKTGDNSYKWLLTLQEKKGVLLPLDRRVELSCDFNTADSMVRTQTQNLAVDSDQPNNIPSVEKPVNSREFVTLAVTDPYTGVALTQARLGDNMQLRMTLALSSGLRARGVSPYSCNAFTADGVYNLVLTDSDGCPAQESSVISELKGSNGTVKSGPFQCFAFPGYSDLSIACSYEFCFTDDNPLCNDRCAAMRWARLTTTTTTTTTSSPFYPTTDYYYYWMTTSPWYWTPSTSWYWGRRKRAASGAVETASTSLHIITDPDKKETGQTASMASTTTMGPAAWVSLLVVAVVQASMI